MAYPDLLLEGGKTLVDPRFRALVGGASMPISAGLGALSGPALIAYLAGKAGPPTPEMSANEGDAAFARNAASTGGTGLLNTPEETEALTQAYYGRPRAAAEGGKKVGYGQTPAPAATPTTDIIAALDAMIAMSGGRGRGGSLGLEFSGLDKAALHDQKLVKDALASLAKGRGDVAGALKARAIPEVFDAAAEDARIRAANPFTKKERTNVFALPMWDAKSNSFVQNPNAVAGAKHLADIDTEEQTLHDKRLAQLLGFGREAVTGKNLQQAMRDSNAIDSAKVLMPTELDMGLIRQQMKGDNERTKVMARAATAAAGGGKDDAITQMLRAYKNKAEAEKSKDPKLVAIADKVIEMLSPKKTAEKVEPKMVEESRTSLSNMLGKKANTPLGEVIMRDFQQNVLVDPAGALRIAREQMDSAGTKKP